MYTGTIFNWIDNSGFEVTEPVVDATNRPLFMVVNGFDKGPEKLMEVDATNFTQLYGTMSYTKYGQASIQAQRIIDAGGRLLVKRVCAPDAKLAYSVLVANIDENNKLTWEIKKTSSTYKKYKDIKPDVLKETGGLYVEGESYPLFIIADNGRGLSTKKVRIVPDYDTSAGLNRMIYRFMIYDGTTLLENANISLDPSFTFNGDYYGLDKNRMIQVTGEVIPEMYDKFVEKYASLIFGDNAVITQDITKYINDTYDLMNAVSIKDLPIYVLTEDEDGEIKIGDKRYKEDTETKAVEYDIDENEVRQGDLLDIAYGNPFKDIGDNDFYGTTPAKFGNEHNVEEMRTTYETLMQTDPATITDPDQKAYVRYVLDIASVYLGYDTTGDPIDEIWDTDAHKLFAVADANYDKLIKDCIANFVEFRQDCLFIRDCGIGFYDVKKAVEVYEKYIINNRMRSRSEIGKYGFNGAYNYKLDSNNQIRSRFIADYATNYQVIDPATRKNIEVTMPYDLVVKLTNLYIEQGPFAPLAGTYNGFQLDSAIPGTINFTPIVTPALNQKQVIDDARLNYAIFEDEDTCVVQSNYTSQNANTQLSFINNVLAIQEVARVVRTACPRNRFRLITGTDMSEYANNVNRVLGAYSNYFETLEFQYYEDRLRSIQKIFYASINFSFNNWAQSEIFDLYALANTTQTSVNS